MGLNDTLPAGMTVAGSPFTDCGGTLNSTLNSVTLVGGILAGSSRCNVVVPVSAPNPGNYSNCIPANSLVDNQNATNITTACDTLTVIIAPAISKAFSPNSILTGTTSALTLTLRNPAANTVPLSGVSFTDTFPAGLTLASVPNSSQCNGTVTSTPNSVTLTGGSIAVNSTCTVTTSVTAATGGSYANVSDPVLSTNGGMGNTASATLTVIAAPMVSKTFAPVSINVDDTSTLTFTLINPAENTALLSGVSFTDAYPFGLTNASPLTTTNNCGGTLTATDGGNSISLTGASIPVNGTCTVSVLVLASNGGPHTNSTTVTSTNGGTGNTATNTLDVSGSGLSLIKATTAAAFQAAGDVINYSYLLANTGTVTLYPPYAVTDDKATVTCPATTASIAPLETVTCTASYTVQAADVTARAVTNIATAAAQDADSGGNLVTSNQSSVTVRLAGLSLIKSASTSGYRTAGNTITYNYTLTNTGSIVLYPPFTVSDDRIGAPLGTPFSCGNTTALSPGANVTCSKNYIVVAADITAGSVTNIATASAQDASSSGTAVTSNQSSVTVYAVVAPLISKSFSPSTIPVGTTSNLTFTITNPATNVVTLTGIGFTDNLPAGTSVAIAPDSAQCGGSVTSTATSVTLSGGNILPNSSCTVTVTVLGTSNGNKNNTSSAVTSTNGGNGNTASATLVVISPPVISKSFAPITASVGGTSTLTFTLTASAGNPAALTGVSFSDNLPSGLQVANPPNATASAGCGSPTFAPAAGDTALTFDNGTISATCTVSVRITPTIAGAFNNTTTAVASTNGGTGTTSNTATLIVDDAVDLSITKTDGKLAMDRGESLTYSITVHNAGPSNATGASIFDTIPSSLSNVTWNCTPGTGASCTANGSGNISDIVTIPAGSEVSYEVSARVSITASTNIVNSASILAPTGMTDSDMSNNSATDTDTLNKLTITKTAIPTVYPAIGEIINYSYTITNEGTSTLTPPFAVTDDKVTPTCNVPATLAPTESFTCTASVSIAQADLDAGSITNIASATSKDADLDTVTSNTDSETVTATQAPGLRLDKSVASGGPYSDVGDLVNYSYILTNTGNVTLSSPFVVSDDKVMVGCPSSTSLAPNDILTCTATYTVMQNDIDIGNVTNTATATAQFGAAMVTSNADSETVNANQNTGLTLVKSITSGNPYTSSGDVIQYSYLLTNTGNVTLQGNGAGNQFTVTDDKATVTCPATPTTLAPNDTITCTASYKVKSGDLGGSVINQATAQALFGSTPVDSNQDSQVAYGSPVLEVTKDDGLSIVAPNASIQYTVTVRNNSLQDASGLQMVDSLPAGTRFGSASNGGVHDSSTGQITWPAFDLAAGNSIQFTVRVQVQDTMQLQAGSITSITNQVTVQDDGSHSNGIPVQANASDTDQITIKGVKILAGTEQPGSLTPKVLIGEILDYSIDIDIPTGTIARLQAVDSLDHGLAFVGCDPTTPIASGTLVIERNPCTDPTALTVQAEPITDTNPASEEAGRLITFDFGQVENASNSAQTLTLNYRVIVLDIEDNVDGLKHLNNRVEWIWSGGTLSGEAQSVEITEPELIIEKTVDPTVAALGNIVTYTIKVEHAASSSAPAHDVIVTDQNSDGIGAGTKLHPRDRLNRSHYTGNGLCIQFTYSDLGILPAQGTGDDPVQSTVRGTGASGEYSQRGMVEPAGRPGPALSATVTIQPVFHRETLRSLRTDDQ